jgi:hypothetical protein
MNEWGEIDRFAIYDLVKWNGKIYSTGGYYETCKPVRHTTEYDSKVNWVWLINEQFIRRAKHIEDVENITLKYKNYKLAAYISRKVERLRWKKALKIIEKAIMHWACKPGGPIYNLTMERFKENQKNY